MLGYNLVVFLLAMSLFEHEMVSALPYVMPVEIAPSLSDNPGSALLETLVRSSTFFLVFVGLFINFPDIFLTSAVELFYIGIDRSLKEMREGS